MTKAQLESKIAQLEKANENLMVRNAELSNEIDNKDAEWQKKFDEQFSYEANSIMISNRDYAHYERLQETTLQSVERADKLQEANTELIKAIATLNGGVLKDLSQTIVNLSKKENRY